MREGRDGRGGGGKGREARDKVTMFPGLKFKVNTILSCLLYVRVA